MTGKDAADSGASGGDDPRSTSQPGEVPADDPHSAEPSPPADPPAFSVYNGHEGSESATAGAQSHSDDESADLNSPEESANWSGEEFELDRLYQEAVEAMEVVEWEHGAPPLPAEETARLNEDGDKADDDSPGTDANTEAATAGTGFEDGEADDQPSELHARVKPGQVIEAALFVGGGPLPARKLAWLLGGSCEPDSVVRMIDELNEQYAAQQRPYEIRLGEGGYHLSLRNEYEPLWHRVFGLGPKEIKLSQEALEVLALVAYQQPVSPEKIDELSKRRAGGVLRQLVRRQLLEIERGETRKDITYRTTARFLEVFGIRSLDELPRAESLVYK